MSTTQFQRDLTNAVRDLVKTEIARMEASAIGSGVRKKKIDSLIDAHNAAQRTLDALILRAVDSVRVTPVTPPALVMKSVSITKEW